jgi:AbrB family looped-hinge helix DNA binding protein
MENFDMETYATVKGQIVIPAPLRKKYGITEGTKIVVVDTGNEILLRPITPQYLKNLRGSLKGTGALQVLVEERKKDKARGK